MNRVVITGMGIHSCIGSDLDSVRQALYDGKSGIIFDPARLEMGFQSGLAGDVPDLDLSDFLSRNQRISLATHGKFAFEATRQALAQAAIDREYLDSHPVGVIYGADTSMEAVVESIDIIREHKSTRMAGAGAYFRSLNSTVSMNLACIFHLKGVNMTLSAACASGGHAIGLAAMYIRQGLQDCIICGGANEIHPYTTAAFDGLNAFSLSNDSPQKASRPFDARRNGVVPSGGAATLILENYDSAMRRGAPIWGEVLGYGFSGDGSEHLSKPDGIQEKINSMEMALRDASLTPQDIGYINAHATSTRLGDAFEARALFEIWKDRMPFVTSTKSQTGHEMIMAGASEVVYSLLMAHNGFIAGNLNFETPDEDTARVNVLGKTTQVEFDTFLSNSFGFGGTNSTIIIKKIIK